MGAGSRALASGFVAFVVATAVTAVATGGDRASRLDAVTVGGLTGGAVALVVWVASNPDR